MTTVVANSSGRKSAKDKKANPNKNASPPTVIPNAVTETINNNSEEFRNKGDKFQPTAEQMRIASLMSDKKEENDLKPKIEQIVELTGASKEDAAVALFDCDNDMAKAIEMILDGDSLDSEWHSTGRKKKTKAQIAGQPELLTNGTKKTEKPLRPNLKNNNAVGNAASPPTNLTKGQARGGFNPANSKIVRKKDGRPSDAKPETVEESDIFAKASTDTGMAGGDSARRGGRRGGLRGGLRGAPRGGGKAPATAGRGSRTFMNRGLQSNNDGFPNSIDTWTNSTAEQAKSNDDLNTMTVGNWSDIAANEDWSEEDWTSAPLETKVFTPSTKTISEKDEIIAEQNTSINNNTSQSSAQLPFISPSKNEESAPPTMSAILSGNIKRSSAATPGQALLQQIQQSSASQNSNLNQYNLSQYSKQATESIKSLVGLNSNNIISNDLIPSNEHSLENNLSQISKQPTQQPNQQQNRLKVQNQKTSKIPETAVEMPSNDPISNLSVHFGTLEFGTNNSFGLGTDSNLFDSVNQSANIKPENKNLSLLSSNVDNSPNSNFRSPNNNANHANKSILQSSGLPPALNDALLNSDHRVDKQLNANNYAPNKQQIERKNEYMNMSYKPYVNNDNAYSSSAYQNAIPSSNVGYYSNANQVTPFGNSAGQSLMASNVYNTTYNNVSANAANNAQNIPKIRDMDNSVVQQQQVSASSVSAPNKQPYESASNVGTSLSLMSNSTVTTNVLKNTLSATGKGVHGVPPGVQQTQVGQVLSTPYIMSNPGIPAIPYPYPYDMQFQATRDHGYPYAAPDVKYNRGSETDIMPVSSQAAGAVQTATQAHNQPYMNTYPPGYGFYFTGGNFAHLGMYNAAQHALYPVAQAQTNAGSAGSAFAKANTAANYGSHSYNSGYDSLGAAVAQNQDYVNKAYPQQMQPHKQMSGANTGDLAGNNPQSMYNKPHSQMNKQNYEKQGFQQSAQFNLANTTQSAATLSSYATPYMLPQQNMHHNLPAEQTQQQQQQPGINQRSLAQAHKGSSANAPYGAKPFNWN